MIGTDLLIAGLALLITVPVGLVAHEWTHALALRRAGVEYEVVYFPDRHDGVLAALASCPWAAVHPRPTGHEPAWHLRVAALVPVVLALPALALSFGAPVDHPVVSAVVIGWLACAIPSPQDFSVAFYAHRVLERTRDGSGVDPR
ncbi:hypothetical protein ACLI4Q_05760 [Natrialbaceae archaeon A-CW1-1]